MDEKEIAPKKLSEAQKAALLTRNPTGKCTLTPELVKRICASIAMGATIPDARKIEGIPCRTFRSWLDKGGKQKQGRRGVYRVLVMDLRKAIAEWRRSLAFTVTGAAASGDWKAAGWLLERRDSRRWAPTSKQEISGKDGAPLPAPKLVIERVGIDWRAARAERFEAPAEPINGNGASYE